MNPIVIQNILTLLCEKVDANDEKDDLSVVYKHFVELISLICAISMYFGGHFKLQKEFMEILIKILHLT